MTGHEAREPGHPAHWLIYYPWWALLRYARPSGRGPFV